MNKLNTFIVQLIRALRDRKLKRGEIPPSENPEPEPPQPEDLRQLALINGYYEWLLLWSSGKYGKQFSYHQLKKLVEDCLRNPPGKDQELIAASQIRTYLKTEVDFAVELLLIENTLPEPPIPPADPCSINPYSGKN